MTSDEKYRIVGRRPYETPTEGIITHLFSDAEASDYDDAVAVCLIHRKFPPCRRDEPHDYSSDPSDVEAVRRYQRGE